MFPFQLKFFKIIAFLMFLYLIVMLILFPFIGLLGDDFDTEKAFFLEPVFIGLFLIWLKLFKSKPDFIVLHNDYIELKYLLGLISTKIEDYDDVDCKGIRTPTNDVVLVTIKKQNRVNNYECYKEDFKKV